MDQGVWVAVILVYYLLATLLPIDKLIGKLYPILASCWRDGLGIMGGLLVGGYTCPSSLPGSIQRNPGWPYMFVTVACGAVSGFTPPSPP